MTGEDAVRLIESAREPAGAEAARSYRRLARLTHPDTSPAEARTRAALTRRLLRARPYYDDAGGDWPSAVAEALGFPVTLTSCGPCAEGERAPACRGRSVRLPS